MKNEQSFEIVSLYIAKVWNSERFSEIFSTLFSNIPGVSKLNWFFILLYLWNNSSVLVYKLLWGEPNYHKAYTHFSEESVLQKHIGKIENKKVYEVTKTN